MPRPWRREVIFYARVTGHDLEGFELRVARLGPDSGSRQPMPPALRRPQVAANRHRPAGDSRPGMACSGRSIRSWARPVTPSGRAVTSTGPKGRKG